MPIPTTPYKGARDFYPADKRIQKYIFKTMRRVVESFGYEEYDAPVLEPTDLYLSKGNAEIINDQTFTFQDRGGRSVTMRTEMTPTVARMIAARRQELAYPVRWYSIPQCWRYERTQRGRGREFYQLNVDIFGIEGLAADHEIIQAADKIMRAFKARRTMYTIKINSRQLVNSILTQYLGQTAEQSVQLIRLIDRMHKLPPEEFMAQASSIMNNDATTAKLLSVLAINELNDLPSELRTHPSVAQLVELLQLLDSTGITNAQFDITLMRGFDYYTDIVFEVFDNHPDNNRSMFGGGRYDGLLDIFGAEPVPTVGFGMGDITLLNFLESHELLPERPVETELYVILIGDVYAQSLAITEQLRAEGIKVCVDATGRKADKQLKTALKKGIHYVMFIGEQELNDEQFLIRNLHTTIDERHSLARVISVIKDYRSK